MPFRLDLNTVKISKRSSGYSDTGLDDKARRFYIRMSAINQEFGEGPYSNIIELRQPDKSKFEVGIILALFQLILSEFFCLFNSFRCARRLQVHVRGA